MRVQRAESELEELMDVRAGIVRRQQTVSVERAKSQRLETDKECVKNRVENIQRHIDDLKSKIHVERTKTLLATKKDDEKSIHLKKISQNLSHLTSSNNKARERMRIFTVF